MNAPTNIERTSPAKSRSVGSLLALLTAVVFGAILLVVAPAERPAAQTQQDVGEEAWATGNNAYGALGNPTYPDGSETPVRVGGNVTGYLTNVMDVAAGDFFSLAVREDGSVWAWGQNWAGQLGDGTNTDRYTPVQVKGPNGVGYLAGIVDVEVFPGPQGAHTVALKNDGTVWAWGYNGNGQLGNGTYDNTSNVPVQVSNLDDVVDIAVGGLGHSLAVKSDGTVWGWGYDSGGQIGTGNPVDEMYPTPVKVARLDNAVAVAAGYGFSLAVKNDGTVWAWGYNGHGQLGNPDFPDGSRVPVQVKGPNGVGYLTGVTDVDAGDSHSLALKGDGTVWSWGANDGAQLGNGQPGLEKYTPVQVVGSGGVGSLTNVKEISAGNKNGLALKGDGTVWGWGNNDAGELGHPGVDNQPTPVQMKGYDNVGYLTGATHVDSGDLHTLVVKNTLPTVTAVKPTAGATGVPRGTNVVATFSEKMDPSTLTGALGKANFKLYRVTATGSVQITNVTVKPNLDGTKATLNPYGTSTTLLAKSTRYMAVVTTGVTDLAGNHMATQKVWYFKTGS